MDGSTDFSDAKVVSIDAGRNGYLTSNLGKARMNISRCHRLLHTLDAQLEDVALVLTRGDTSAVRPCEEVASSLRDLRIFAADLETFVRLHEAATAPEPPEAA